MLGASHIWDAGKDSSPERVYLSDQLLGEQKVKALDEQDPNRQWWAFSSCHDEIRTKNKKIVCTSEEIVRIENICRSSLVWGIGKLIKVLFVRKV